MPNSACCTSALLAALVSRVFAQTATGGIVGKVVTETGQTVRAIVTLGPTSALGHPSGRLVRAFALGDGAFSFAGVKPGSYTVCTQIPASEASRSGAPFLDTCEWASAAAPVQVAAGKQVSGLAVTAPKGAVLQIQVNDPGHVLPAVASAKGPSMLEPQLVLILRAADRLIHHPRFVSQTAVGRTYQAVVPANTPVNITIASAVATVFDQSGNKVSGELPTQAPAGPTPSVIAFTLQTGN
jgi:hypothetical protein